MRLHVFGPSLGLQDAYLADVAGLHYSTSPEGLTGLEIRVDGFNHKLPLLTQRIFSTMVSVGNPEVSRLQRDSLTLVDGCIRVLARHT